MAEYFSRRAVLRCALGVGVGAACLPLRARGQGGTASDRPRAGDVLVRAGDPSQTALEPFDVPERATPLLVWAADPVAKIVRSGSRLNQVILMRFAPAALAERTRARAADGVVAYTAICPHGGCEVLDWLADEHALSCSCHASLFDPADEAVVLTGPAPRSLPALPLGIVDGHLVVAGAFTSVVGFESA